jgi:GNAT superfamily N-acetyltransferase
MQIRSLIPPPWPLFASLIQASCDEGFTSLVRLQDEYLSGKACFDGAGEALFGAFQGTRLIGVAGLSRDRYANDPNIGCVRHLYVLPQWRRHSIGTNLLAAIERQAQAQFSALVVRADTEIAASFCESLGYERKAAVRDATHRRTLATARTE